MSFGALASLLLPADPGRTGTVVETDESWSLPAGDAATDVVLWGRGSLLSGTPRLRAARSAVARERAIRSIRRRGLGSGRFAGLHRLHPPVLAGGGGRNRRRAALLGGAVVEVRKEGEEVRRIIDAVAEAARCPTPVGRLSPGSGGSALVRTQSTGGDLVLRTARSGHPADPGTAAAALAALEPLGLEQVPRLLGQGEVAGASWTTESSLPGRRPARVSAAMASDVAGLCSALPSTDSPATAHEEDLRSLAGRFPRWAQVLSQLAEDVNDVARAVPSLARHGDLWAGNLLVRRGRLTGLVDWDAWHPSALPGTDLLHLVATDEGFRGRRGLGETWLHKPWTGDAYRTATTEYWTSLRIAPNARLLDAVGVAWWAGHVAATLHRLPRLAEDGRWVASNVDQVLEALAGPA